MHECAKERMLADQEFKRYMSDNKPGGGQYWDYSWRGVPSLTLISTLPTWKEMYRVFREMLYFMQHSEELR